MAKGRRVLGRLHVWLGWVVGVPLLFWTVSGFWMVLRPIEEVRGTDLRRASPALTLPSRLVPPVAPGRALQSLTIETSGGSPVWAAGFADGGAARADLATGRWLPPVDAAEARAIATRAYRPRSRVTATTLTPAEAPPLDFRRPRPAWGVRFADGTHLYVDRETGAVLALRTRQWRAFDWMWGLHIMDLGEREDTSHPLLIGAAGLSLVLVLLGLILLPMTGRRRR